MEFNLKEDERYTVLQVLESNLNSYVAPELKSEFVTQAKKKPPVQNLILDLSKVEFVDSSGLSAILTADRLWKDLDGSFIVTGVNSPSVKRLMEISRLESILVIIPTIQESIEYAMLQDLERELNADIDLEE